MCIYWIKVPDPIFADWSLLNSLKCWEFVLDKYVLFIRLTYIHKKSRSQNNPSKTHPHTSLPKSSPPQHCKMYLLYIQNIDGFIKTYNISLWRKVLKEQQYPMSVLRIANNSLHGLASPCHLHPTSISWHESITCKYDWFTYQNDVGLVRDLEVPGLF